jgi:pilus assembly protein Flp/PilA
MTDMYAIWIRDILKLSQDRRAVTALEYGLIAALIAVVIIGAVTTLGQSLSDTFSGISRHFGSNGVTN